MARVTVEDSLKTMENQRFHMIQLAAYRAHQLQHGAKPKVKINKDKPTVIALREIAAGYIEFGKDEVPEKDIFGKAIEEVERENKETSTDRDIQAKP